MTTIKAYLVEGHGRSSVFTSPQPWAEEDSNYKVVPLVPMELDSPHETEFVGEVLLEPPSLSNTDDTQERIELMNQLFDLQQQEIDFLKVRLEKFVEVVEGIVELTEVVSQSSIENRSKLLVISKSCNDILKPDE
ncbi:hypothetical protein [Robertmurraya sp.]|uniref:hypothetical protein n=1 Tax=Robertmurraya sp. TaxID=2837525 RepID=UPI0037042B91